MLPLNSPRTDSDILGYFYKRLDPQKAAGEFYVNCSEERGGANFVKKLCKSLAKSRDEDLKRQSYIHALFAGHIGGGKSSELIHLRDEMKSDEPKYGHNRLFPVYVDIRDYLDDFDAAREELLLAVVSEFGARFQEDEGIMLTDSAVTRRVNDIINEMLRQAHPTELEVNAPKAGIAVPGLSLSLPEVKVKFMLLRSDRELRERVRRALEGKTSTFLDELNILFEEARLKLRKHTPRNGGEPYDDFVLIVDGLDRLFGYNDKKTQEEAQKALFVDDAEVLIRWKAHCVFTIDLATARAHSSELTSKYGAAPYLLPMVKIESRGIEHAPYPNGREKLKAILQKRLPPEVRLDTVFEPRALEQLVYFSAGHIRSLMLFAREAIVESDDILPLSEKTVLTAIAQNNPFQQPLRGADDWKRLAELELDPEQFWQAQDPDCRRLLQQLFVCEYVNGGNDSIIPDAEKWYAVNPLVRDGRGFKRALEEAKKTPKAAST